MTDTTSPARFALDREAATAWLTQARPSYGREVDEKYKHLGEVGDDYTAQDDWDSGSETAALVSDAQQLGAITGPYEITYDYDYSSYGDHGYTWCLRVGKLNVRTLFTDLKHCGDGGEQPGIPAALAVLREAVNAGNDLLGDLAAYVAAQPRDGYVEAECVIVDARLTEPQFRRIGELLNTPLGRHKPDSYRYVFEPESAGEADRVCEYLRLCGIPYERQTTTRWEP